LTERLGVFAEVFGTSPIDASTGARNSVDGGLTFLLTEVFQLDVAGGAGISEDADDWFVGAGLSFRLPM